MTDQEIVLARIARIYDIPPFVVRKSGQMKMILRCCGLGEYYDKYSEYLEPYWYNRGYKNDVNSYRIFLGLDLIFGELVKLQKDGEILAFLTELGNNISPTVCEIDGEYKDDFDTLNRLYHLMGLELEAEYDDKYGFYNKVHTKSFVGEVDRFNDTFEMEKWLGLKYSGVYDAYESALDSFSQGNLGAAIESCRTTLTGLFSQFKGIPFENAKWKLGMAKLTGDFQGTTEADSRNMNPINKELDELSKSDLTHFFGDCINGNYKKTKAIYAIYSMLSDYGTHRQEGAPEVATKEDALMMIRMTTDILVWIYQKKGKEI